jgi:FAD/FMN-containing dehydrogenase
MTNATLRLRESGTTTLPADVLASLSATLRGHLVFPTDASYDETRKLWNGMFDRRPGLIVRCKGPSDVIATLQFARLHKLLFTVKGGGHGMAGHAAHDEALMIDLSLMRGIRVDPVARTLRAEAGCTWGDVDRESQAFSLVVPGGVVADTGIAGLTLGGGYSWVRRKYGMSIDALLSVDLVTADGRYLTASASENPDLFWALRGGGGNFGIVTSFEYRAYPLGPEVMLAAPMYPLEDGVDILRAWRDLAPGLPDEITSDAVLWMVPHTPPFPENTWGRAFVMTVGVYAGDPEEGQRRLQPLRELGTPFFDMSGPIPWVALQGMFDPFFPKGGRYYFKSSYLNSLSDQAIDGILTHQAARTSPKALTSIRLMGGAIARPAATATGFGNRNAPFLLSIDNLWDEPAEDQAQLAWARAYWNDMQRFSNGQMYFNFPGALEEGPSLIKNSFGGNHARLQSIKRQYDPENLFRMNQNIVPA